MGGGHIHCCPRHPSYLSLGLFGFSFGHKHLLPGYWFSVLFFLASPCVLRQLFTRLSADHFLGGSLCSYHSPRDLCVTTNLPGVVCILNTSHCLHVPLCKEEEDFRNLYCVYSFPPSLGSHFRFFDCQLVFYLFIFFSTYGFLHSSS